MQAFGWIAIRPAWALGVNNHDHRRAGRLVFETEHLVPVGAPDVRVVVHLGVEGDDSAARLARS